MYKRERYRLTKEQIDDFYKWLLDMENEDFLMYVSFLKNLKYRLETDFINEMITLFRAHGQYTKQNLIENNFSTRPQGSMYGNLN